MEACVSSTWSDGILHGSTAVWRTHRAGEVQPSESSDAALSEIVDLSALKDMPKASGDSKRAAAAGLPSVSAGARTTPARKKADSVASRGRARRGEATDKHSICERTRRTKIAKSMRALHKLIPDASKTIKTLMLDDVIRYVRMLQMRVQMEGMRKLDGSSDAAPTVALPNAAIDKEEWRRSCKRIYANRMIERVLDPSEDRLAEAERQFMSRLAHPSDHLSLAASYLASAGLALVPISHLSSAANASAPGPTHPRASP